jgi:hypothetical protein
MHDERQSIGPEEFVFYRPRIGRFSARANVVEHISSSVECALHEEKSNEFQGEQESNHPVERGFSPAAYPEKPRF